MTSLNLAQIWKKTLEILESELSRPSFDTWLKSTELLFLDDNIATIAVPNEFAKDWLETRYYNLIKNTLHLLTNYDFELTFLLPSEVQALDYIKHNSKQETGLQKKQKANPDLDISLSPIPQLNNKYTFDTFVVGNSNRFAHAASLAVAEAPAKSYNPLFIYGGVGLGKTHLMHAIGHYVLSQLPNYRVLYVSSETFTNELINAIRDDKTLQFRNKYRNIEVLLIDDIQFLAGKERTQEEFFHTFNALHEANKQLVISSDRPPREIPTLEDRLRSRFEWGLITDIQPPDLETRIAILRKKASLEQLELPDEVMVFIAKKIKSNIRELEGALIRVAAFASFVKKDITPELAEEALQDLFPFDKPQKITIDLIQKTVAETFGLKQEDLKAKKRTRSVAFPRQIAMYLCRELTDASLPRIGDEFGGRDHTTVLHAYEKIERDLKEDTTLENTIADLIKKITNA